MNTTEEIRDEMRSIVRAGLKSALQLKCDIDTDDGYERMYALLFNGMALRAILGGASNSTELLIRIIVEAFLELAKRERELKSRDARDLDEKAGAV